MRPYLRSANIGWSGLELSDVKEMNFDAADFERFRLDVGDVLLNEGSGSASEVGKPAIWRGEIDGCCFQNTLLRVKPRGATPEYLRYYFEFSARSGRFVGETQGVNIFHIGRDGLASYPVPVPPIAEQQRIVAKLDALTARTAGARADLDRIPALADRYRQAVLTAAFSDPSVVRPLGEIIDEGPENGWSPASSPEATGALTLKLSATTSGEMRLDAQTTKRIHTTPPESSKYWLRPGDLLIQRANSLEHVGASAIFDGPPRTYIYPDLMMRVRIADPELRQLVWRHLNSEQARQYFRENATGTAGNMPKINGQVVRALPVPLPAANDRSRLRQQIDAAFAEIDRLAAEAAAARRLIDRLHQAILAKAFRGELVPQDPNDEPAGVLLERIRAERAAAPKPKRGRKTTAA
jgi:type I restriction enzyme S subunit